MIGLGTMINSAAIVLGGVVGLIKPLMTAAAFIG